jgi:hypothetical protein
MAQADKAPLAATEPRPAAVVPTFTINWRDREDRDRQVAVDLGAVPFNRRDDVVNQVQRMIFMVGELAAAAARLSSRGFQRDPTLRAHAGAQVISLTTEVSGILERLDELVNA